MSPHRLLLEAVDEASDSGLLLRPPLASCADIKDTSERVRNARGDLARAAGKDRMCVGVARGTPVLPYRRFPICCTPLFDRW